MHKYLRILGFLAIPLLPSTGFAQSGGCTLTTPVSGTLSYTLEFDTDGAIPDLVKVLQVASSLYAERKAEQPDSVAILSKARTDYANLLSALYAEGYYGGTIAIRVNGQEAASISPTAFCPASSDIRIAVIPGPVFQFGEVAVQNYPDIPLPAAFSKGAVAKVEVLSEIATDGVTGWRAAGHAAASVSEQSIIADHRTNTLNVTLGFDPGPATGYGNVNVKGNASTKIDFIRYMVNLPEGKSFDPADMENAQRRLIDSGAFGSVLVEDTGVANPDGTVDVTVQVSEHAPRRIGFGATVSSIDGLALEGYWFHRNLFGSAERLRFDASISGVNLPLNGDDFDYTFGAGYSVPGFLTPDTSLQTRAELTFGNFANFQESGLNVSAGLTHWFGPDLTGGANAFYDHSRVMDGLGTTDYDSVGLEFFATLDRRDNALGAESGFYLSGSAMPFTDLANGGIALRGTVDGRIYQKLDSEGQFVLAGRVQAGSILTTEGTSVSPDQLFFVGGGGSLRGYPYLSKGVEVGGDQVGGNSMLVTSVELRAWVTESIGVVGFADAGIVSPTAFPDFSEPWIIGVGLGLRYQTGLGAVRLDVGLPLDAGPDDAGLGIYMGLGQAF